MMFEPDDREEDPNPSESGNAHAPFVGRKEVKVQIKEDIKKKDFQLFQITGGAVVGKSRLAEVISDELYKESLDYDIQLKCMSLALRNKTAECLELMKMKILQEFGKEDRSSSRFDFMDEIKETLKRTGAGKKYFLILMDDCDQMISDGSRTAFISLVSTLVRSCSRVKVILTSREKFDFPRLCDSARHYPLSGLTDAESVELLNRSAPNVQFSQHEQLIIKHCSGLPLLLIILARTLEDNKAMLTKEDFLEVLEKFPLDGWNVNRVSDEDSIEKIMEQFVACLDIYLKQNLSILSYFPGGFSAEAGAAVAGISRESEAKVFALIPLHKKSMVDFDAVKNRYSISSVIRQYANTRLSHLRDNDTVRLRFCQYYSTILCNANNNLFEKPNHSIVSSIYDEWANVEQTLREASEPSRDLFAINMKIVRDAPSVITAMVPELAEAYYRRCKSAAELFGTEFDVACIESCLGASVGYVKGYELKHALDILLETEKKIPLDAGFQRVKLCSHIEWNLYRQGKIEEAMRYQDLGLAVEPSGADKRRIQSIQVNINNHKALALILLGRLDDARLLLKETVDFTNKTFTNHPGFRAMLNTLGLVYSEQKDEDTALKYFLASLTERRKCAGPEKRNVVIALVNVGNKLLKRNKCSLALRMLEEAVEIRRKLEWVHLDTAVVLYQKGKILRACERYEEALQELEESLRVYRQCVDTHWVTAGVRVEIAECLRSLGRSGEAEQILKAVLTDRISLEQNKQLDIYIVKAFDLLMKLTSERHEEWKRIADEKCTYYESLIRDENNRDAADQNQYEEDLKSLRETIDEKMEKLKPSAPLILESDVAVYKLIRAEGQPHNRNCNISGIKSSMKGKDTNILQEESSEEQIAEKVLERRDSTVGGPLENKPNDKIINVDIPVCCNGKLPGRILGSSPDIKTTRALQCDLHVPRTQTQGVSGQIRDTQLAVSNQSNYIVEQEPRCDNVHRLPLGELNATKQCSSKDVQENPCNSNAVSYTCSGSSGIDHNNTTKHKSSDNGRVNGYSLANSCSNFPRDRSATSRNCGGKTESYNRTLQCCGFPEATKSKEISENRCSRNMLEIKRDSACLPVDSRKLDDCHVNDQLNEDNGNIQEIKRDSACLSVDSRKLDDCHVNDQLNGDNGNTQEMKHVSAFIHVDPLKLDDGHVDDHFDSDTSTITGSSMSSTETVIHLSLDNKPD